MDMLDFLRLHEIAPKVFETEQHLQSIHHQLKDFGDGSLGNMIQNYRNEMLG